MINKDSNSDRDGHISDFSPRPLGGYQALTSIDAYEVRPRWQISVAARRVERMNFEAAFRNNLSAGFLLLLGSRILADESPGNNAQNRTDERRDQVLEGDLDLAEA